MTWRCANRRKARRLQLAAVEPYLGDIIGAMPAPMRPVYMPADSARCFTCRRTHRWVAGCGAAAMAVLGIIHVAMLVAT